MKLTEIVLKATKAYLGNLCLSLCGLYRAVYVFLLFLFFWLIIIIDAG
jgi:hypothetical protein